MPENCAWCRKVKSDVGLWLDGSMYVCFSPRCKSRFARRVLTVEHGEVRNCHKENAKANRRRIRQAKAENQTTS